MSIEKLVSFIGKSNIADTILEEDGGEDTLKNLAKQVCEDKERDLDSMTDWSQMVDDGREIAKQENRAKSEPWEGAANFKSPAMLEASVSFGDRATTELLRNRNLLKADEIGKDKEGRKKQQAKNVVEYMNWQLNYEMEDWRDIQETLFYELPNTGTVFKKTYFDTVEKVNRSELIHYPDFIVNQATPSMLDCPSFTQVMAIPYYRVLELQRSGIWSDVEIYNEDSDALEGSNQNQEVIHALDNEEDFLEQRCLYDLDGDGYPEPYIVTVHEQSQKVVRIVARFHANHVYVKDESGNIGILGEVEDATEIVKIKPFSDITKYGFIKSQDGTFLDIGYCHILTSILKAVNSTTNQLLDAGSLANLQGGFVAKGFRKRMGNVKLKPGSWESTDISAADLRNGIMPHQFKEPSQTLYSLREMLAKEGDDLTVNMDLQGVLAPNAPATTTLALIQENMVPTSAIMQRIIRSESHEFRRLFELNAIYTDPREYRIVLDDEEANYKNDFNIKSMDIMPTASAEMSSRIQRLQQASVMMDQAQIIAMSGGDVRPIYENWFDAIGAEYMVNQVWPDPAQMSEAQQQRMQEMQEKQRKEKMLLGIEIDQSERELELKEKLGNADLALKQAELQTKSVELRKTESEVTLNLEKAESEQVKNQIDMYTASLEGVRRAIDMIESEINATRDVSQNVGPPTSPPGQPPRLFPVAG